MDLVVEEEVVDLLLDMRREGVEVLDLVHARLLHSHGDDLCIQAIPLLTPYLVRRPEKIANNQKGSLLNSIFTCGKKENKMICANIIYDQGVIIGSARLLDWGG
jgi:hypothetical protein